MKEINGLMEKLNKVDGKIKDLINKSQNSTPFSEDDKKELGKLKCDSKELEKELRSALYNKYDELSDESKHIPGYSTTDFEKDMNVSYNKVIEELSKCC